MTGEGLFAPRFESLFPVANEIVVEAEAACGLGEGVALLGDELDGLRFELRGVGASRSCHVEPPKSEFTLLSGCPPFVGRSTGAIRIRNHFSVRASRMGVADPTKESP